MVTGRPKGDLDLNFYKLATKGGTRKGAYTKREAIERRLKHRLGLTTNPLPPLTLTGCDGDERERV
jgi:hypothetical protein